MFVFVGGTMSKESPISSIPKVLDSYPTHDPWNVPFSRTYNPHRFELAGTLIGEIPEGNGGWKGVLEGIQSDQDFLRLMFNLRRGPNTQLCCHYCDSIQWVSTRSTIGPLNNAESLYTVFGPRESDCTTLRKNQYNLYVISFWISRLHVIQIDDLCLLPCARQGSYRGMSLSLFMEKHQSAKLLVFSQREAWLANWKNRGCAYSQF